MNARMTNPVFSLPGAAQPMMAVSALVKKHLPGKLAALVEFRASQINGCGFCSDMHGFELKEMGETDERMWTVAAWRDAPYFTDAERAALALTEAATRLNDRADAVPDEIWNEARKHYDDQALSALVMVIALINFWNRLSVTTRQSAGEAAHAAAKMSLEHRAA